MAVIARIDTTLEAYSLFDSETNEELESDDLGVDLETYEFLIRESFAQGTVEGHIRLEGGRRVYASSLGQIVGAA